MLRFDRYTGWLDRAVRDGGVTFTSANSSRELTACDGVRIFGRTVYSFFGNALFLLIAAGGDSRAAALYVPTQDRIYDFGADLSGPISHDGMANALGLLPGRVAEERDAH